MHGFISTFTDLFKRHSYSYLPDPDLHSYGVASPTMHHSENDILFLQRSASFVKRPSLCWNYDSPSGMQRWVPWWHLVALLGDNNSNSAKRAGVHSGRLPPGASHATPEASPPPPLFAKVRAQSAELFTSNCLAGSGCRCYCFCVWFCLLTPSFLSPLHLVSAGCQGAWRVSF